jgi:nucleotide-binding universal stress UspA family protein
MKTQITKIIITTDFSVFSENAFKTALAIAQRHHAEVTILHVMDKIDNLSISKSFQSFKDISTNQIRAIGKSLDMLAARIHKNTGLKISSKVIEGLPADKICAYAFQQKASLVVMGTHGISGVRELFMGSDAFKIVKHCSCPVLTVPSEWSKTSFGKVIFPVQLKPGSFEKYFYARSIIEKNNSELYILGLSERNKPGELKELTSLVDKVKLQLHNDRVKFQSAFSPCVNFSDKVVQVADEFSAELAVVALNSEDDFNSSRFSDFAQQLLHRLKIPLLTIKPFSRHISFDLQQELAYNMLNTINKFS